MSTATRKVTSPERHALTGARAHPYPLASRVLREVFVVSLTTYLIFYLIEDVIPGFISFHLNIGVLLGIVFASGALLVLTMPHHRQDHAV